jgi:hypothetical protein
VIDIPQPPNGDGGLGKYVPWAVSVVVALVAALWGAFRGKDAKLVGGLEAQLVERAREITELKTTIVKLGEKLDAQRAEAEAKLDAERAAHKHDQDRALAAILHNDWHEAPTGMRAVCELVAGASIHPDPPEPPRPGKGPVRIPR